MKNKKNISSEDLAVRVSVISILINLVLSFVKFLAGIIASSSAMISDAIHSASDVFSTIIVIIGITLSNKKSDDEHPYGHERLECVAAIILAIVLSFTGIGVGISGINKIMSSNSIKLQVPGILALVAALLSILVKEWMYWYTRNAAKKINSTSLMADAWHHRSDALSSIGALIGIAGSRIGYPIFDPIASVIICAFILKAAYEIFKDSMDKMVDKSCSDNIVENMKTIIIKQEGVEKIDDIKTRLFGSKIYVDVEISVDGDIKLYDAHKVAEKVHDEIESRFMNVKHCMVHVNPIELEIEK